MPRKKGTAKKVERKAEDENQVSESSDSPQTIYEFTAKSITGEEVSFEKYRGCVCIIVNVASNCGYTASNYKQLVELHEKFSKDKNLKILAFPCNQFGSQEPGTADTIRKFVESKNVKFDVFEKIKVNGKDAHPLWKFLKDKQPGPKGKNIKWNFTKFVINEDGIPVARYRSGINPIELTESLLEMWETSRGNVHKSIDLPK